ncbi:MAG: primosomal protein N' [Chloroflexi bacterium]|nr:primosomal protein N' [Chloroflexota bacterium]
MFARLAVNLPAVNGVFDYSIPDELGNRIQVGSLVSAPFGSKVVQGVILEITDTSTIHDPKRILDLLDPSPVLTQPLLGLAIQLSETTLNPLAAVVGLMLPAGLSQQADVLYRLERPDLESAGLIQKRIVELLLKRGPLRGRQIDSHFGRVEWRRTASTMIRKGILSCKNVLPAPRVRPKHIRVAQLAVPPIEAHAAMESLGTRQTILRRQKALQFLMSQPLAINLSWVYAESGSNLADLQELEERGLIRLFENEIFRDPLETLEKSTRMELPPSEMELTQEQTNALGEILKFISGIGDSPPILLHGVTGSGKTEVYLRATEQAIKNHKEAIILVPEISLTPQMVRRFLHRFPGQVGLVHSRLSDGERYDTWRRARIGNLKVIIGARSALFTPLPHPGLIVIDECHDPSYHQSEPPFYDAVDSAIAYSRLCGAVCVLGSATPTIEQRYMAERGAWTRIELPRRIKSKGLPAVEVVDMRQEFLTGNRGIFSRSLVESLAETIERKEQAILFLNRRGTATYVFCRECGAVVKCPNCDVPLTLHVEGTNRPESLTCHRCGYERQTPKKCSACGSPQIRAYGMGSEKVEAEVKALFPTARTLRWDWETTRQKNAHEIILTHFSNHQADVLIGTQMLAKGLDLPLVTLVGVVLAEVGLNFPDPFASERVFQLLTQVAGRAGRSDLGGKVIFQTFVPDHYALQFAAKHDVDGFYGRELGNRRQLGYPPFTKLVRLEFRHLDAAKVKKEANALADRLKVKLEAGCQRSTELIGPVPCYFEKEGGEYRWQIILRGSNPQEVLRDLNLKDWRIETDPVNLL